MFKKARSLQFGWFTINEPQDLPGIFKSLAGMEHSSFQKVSPPQAPVMTLNYTHSEGDKLFRLAFQPGRLDYFVETIWRDKPSLIEEVDSLVDEVVRRATSILPALGVASRLSLVINLFEPMDSKEAGAKAFGDLFGGKFEFGSMEDLVLQFNRRTTDRSGIAINRLLKWEVEDFAYVTMHISGGAISPFALNHLYGLSYMIDVNTAAVEGLTFNHESGANALASLLEIARDLTQLRRIEDLQ